MGCNFSVEFIHRASCQVRGFKNDPSQSIASIAAYLRQFKQEDYMSALKEFSLLVALAQNDTLPLKVINLI